MVVADLEAGSADDQVQWIAAQMLKPKQRGRGRPSHPPMKWLDAGAIFEELYGDGTTYEAAILATAEKIGKSPEHVETAVAFYRRSRDHE